VSHHRAHGRPQVRPLHRAEASHRDSVQAGAVKVGMVGALATATIAVPLASATASGHDGPPSQLGGPSIAAHAVSHSGTSDAAPAARDTAVQLPSTMGADLKATTGNGKTTAGKGNKAAEDAETAALEIKKADGTFGGETDKTTTAPSSEGYIAPVNAPITSGYGGRTHPVLGTYKVHEGVDFGAACGAPVHAAADGKVVAVEHNSASGNRVKVDHGNGVITGYYHMQSFHTSVGATVSQGDVVGYVGSTGRSTGCHLHFAKMDQNGTYSNPMSLLD
jgi:murein DD-endopeptidase MepM/ murein hydrolase activator NlpD